MKKFIFKIIKFLIVTIKRVFVLAIILTLIALWVTVIEPNNVIVRKDTLYIPNWSKNLDGFKVAVLADFHTGTKYNDLKKLNTVADLTNQQKPDLIVLLGDFDTYTILNHHINRKEMVNILKKLSAPCGVISVLGNHDVKNDIIIINILKKSGIKLLQDSVVPINYKKSRISIAGIRDYWHYKLNVKGTIAPINNKDPIILLSHNPDVFPQVPSRVSLTLSGHTHGGLIILPFIGSLFSPSDYYQRYVKGYIVENNRHMYVTSGLSGYPPVRFNNPPEIVILTLKSQINAKKPVINTVRRSGINNSLIPLYYKLKKRYKNKINW